MTEVYYSPARKVHHAVAGEEAPMVTSRPVAVSQILHTVSEEKVPLKVNGKGCHLDERVDEAWAAEQLRPAHVPCQLHLKTTCRQARRHAQANATRQHGA